MSEWCPRCGTSDGARAAEPSPALPTGADRLRVSKSRGERLLARSNYALPMPTVGPPPFFRGKRILVDFDADVRNARIVQAGIVALVTRLEDEGAVREDVVRELPALVALYEGLTGRLVAVTRDTLEFWVRRQ